MAPPSAPIQPLEVSNGCEHPIYGPISGRDGVSRSLEAARIVLGLAALMAVGIWTSAQAWPPAGAGQASRAGGKAPLTLTYVANSGVLAASGGVKVLIDALFDKPNPDYRAPAPDVLEKITKGTAPFDGVKAAFVTHNHPDHFDARVAIRFLETCRDALLVAPADAVAEMRSAAADWTKVERRVIVIDVAVGAQLKREVGPITVTAFRTQHSGGTDSPTNVMYLLEFGGWRLFHEGDSPGNLEEYQRLGLGSARVDLAMVHFWFPLDPNGASFLQEVLRPAHIALTHLPIRLEGDAPGKIDQVQKNYSDIFLLLPGMAPKTLPAFAQTQ
jgi:L-ascorbate metabolism protein UlaG (beta-lactamase superfamily)